MCREVITIAQCSPEQSPVLSFNCGKLHLVAHERVVCDGARGKCICFFGTCGSIGREIPTKGMDLASVVKARCAECTPRQDRIGDHRKAQDMLESPLLQPAVAKGEWPEHSKKLSALWLGKLACPYHAEASVGPATPVTESVTSIKQPVQSKATATDTAVGFAVKTASQSTVEPFAEPPTLKAPDSTSTDPAPAGSPAAPPSAGADEWATNTGNTANTVVDEWDTNTANPVDHEKTDEGFDSGNKTLDPSEVGISTSRWAPGNASSSEPTGEVKGKEQAPVVVSASRRAVNFSYDPNNAEKLQETSQKFADLKASFLMGKA
ncbi:cytochrome P450 monooxygenase [Fusarium beomiforme]|uniref:Cytochrome P450 monooxygenase n=1 Tax=Fusarium beomiforme TaxID=44412 RepID=A0A9P5AK32_9HYPO|nr:cytochrome P450 monooxygenase [Fusarium beomiforme]